MVKSWGRAKRGENKPQPVTKTSWSSLRSQESQYLKSNKISEYFFLWLNAFNIYQFLFGSASIFQFLYFQLTELPPPSSCARPQEKTLSALCRQKRLHFLASGFCFVSWKWWPEVFLFVAKKNQRKEGGGGFGSCGINSGVSLDCKARRRVPVRPGGEERYQPNTQPKSENTVFIDLHHAL